MTNSRNTTCQANKQDGDGNYATSQIQNDDDSNSVPTDLFLIGAQRNNQHDMPTILSSGFLHSPAIFPVVSNHQDSCGQQMGRLVHLLEEALRVMNDDDFTTGLDANPQDETRDSDLLFEQRL